MAKKGTTAKPAKSEVSTPPAKAAPADVPIARGRPSALLDTRVVYRGDCLEQLSNLTDACVDLADATWIIQVSAVHNEGIRDG